MEINNLEIYESKIVVLIWGKTIHYPLPPHTPPLHTSDYLLPTKSKVTTDERQTRRMPRDASQDNGFKGLRKQKVEVIAFYLLRLSSPPRRE